jgi:hypothetical protein
MEQGLLKLEELSPAQLSDYIQGLIDRDFNSLLQLLYRLDVSEEKLRFHSMKTPKPIPAISSRSLLWKELRSAIRCVGQ